MLDLLLLIPALVQALAMGVDEFYYHHRRGLGRWERVGHPIDTLTVMGSYVPLVTLPFSQSNVLLFLTLGFLSCLVVTKDEWVHQQECPPGEHWLHSLLFVMHPIIFMAAGVSWYLIEHPRAPLWGHLQWATPDFLRSSLLAQLAAVCIVFVYQTLYWNYLWKPQTSR